MLQHNCIPQRKIWRPWTMVELFSGLAYISKFLSFNQSWQLQSIPSKLEGQRSWECRISRSAKSLSTSLHYSTRQEISKLINNTLSSMCATKWFSSGDNVATNQAVDSMSGGLLCLGVQVWATWCSIITYLMWARMHFLQIVMYSNPNLIL